MSDASNEKDSKQLTSAIIGKKLSEIVPANNNQIIEETKQFLSSQKLNLSEYRQIWKGIFFAMWASDKVPVQEKLGEELSSLVFSVATQKFEAVSLWMRACFSILKKEWNKIDYWRVNKFSSLVRKTITAFLRYLRKKGFNLAYVREYNKIIQEELYVEITSTVGGLALHVLQIYPEVIAGFTWANHEQVHLLLDLFLKQIGPAVCKNLKNKIKEHIFEKMLAMKESESKFQNFNMKRYRDSLFKIAKNQKTEETARKEIYDIVELFDSKVNMEEEEARFEKYIKEKEEKEIKSKEKKEELVKSEKKKVKNEKTEKEELAPKKKQKLNEEKNMIQSKENSEKNKKKENVEEKKETVKSAKEIKIEKKKLEKLKRVEEEEARLFAEEQKKIDEENKVVKQKLKKGETPAAFIKTHEEEDDEEDEEKDQDWLDENDEDSDNEEDDGEEDEEEGSELESDLDEEELAMLLKSTGEDIEVDDMDDDFYNEEDFEGYDVADVTQNEKRMKGLQTVYDSLPKYHFLTDPQKQKYFNSVTNKFKNNLQEEHLSPCSHSKKVVFNTHNNKVKEFDLNQEVVSLEKTPTIVKAKKGKKNQK